MPYASYPTSVTVVVEPAVIEEALRETVKLLNVLALTVIELEVSDTPAEGSVTVIVCEPAVSSANPLNVWVPLSFAVKVYSEVLVYGKIALLSDEVK